MSNGRVLRLNAPSLSPTASSFAFKLIYNSGVPFPVIMWVWSALACLVFLNCFLNWPAEAFYTPEEFRYVIKHVGRHNLRFPGPSLRDRGDLYNELGCHRIKAHVLHATLCL